MDGWEPAEVTQYEYDAEGRVTRSLTIRETEFDDIDVAKLLAVKELQRDTGRYGESISEAFSDQADPNYEEPDAIRYVPTYRVQQAEAAVELYREQHKDKIPRGAHFFVERHTYS